MADKQEEIRIWIAEQFYGGYCEPEDRDGLEWQVSLSNADRTLKFLDSKGVVIKIMQKYPLKPLFIYERLISNG
jgi:hypothetical protein